ncbi:MAG: pyridoxamine kinase [Fusobacterium varium]|jgi:pyridoxine kinase|uniref:pyridoxamine kinase n=1 Tax=Fusobacterium TaxID=848 RepID=UPI0008A35978|nr:MULTISPECIES: pyridoxamine kinase [Fusobacterium]MCD7980082.1 pyridoxamine kinase [Fusobacterium sp.]MCF0171350.1 pyridoxamine kinase [Fusobacterium varium]MCF2673188.1 pyridoxamine kinase [Fusobacterium varium]MCI6031235.1 pyridoxamine kinase [Fusobacterium varium]MDY4005012.1 pyridoxamine kinase [Fusobacterium varium]
MDNIVKKVAAIHDLSGYGRSSLTSIIPILSSMKLQVCPVPTAVLSTHTGGFEGFSFLDLTDYMEQHIAHWKKLGLEFDCIYSGFLGSPRQIKIVADFVDFFGHKNNLTVIDPVLGDNGRLYGTMGKEMVEEMKKLIGKADIITPNFTEVTFLLDKEYKKEISEAEIKQWLIELAAMGPKIVIATSVPDEDSHSTDRKTNVVAYDRENDVFWKVSCKYIPASYPGTGDAYTSVVIGSLLQGDSLPIAIERGVQFITQCILASYGFKYPNREGVLLERMLDVLKMPTISNSYELLKNEK